MRPSHLIGLVIVLAAGMAGLGALARARAEAARRIWVHETAANPVANAPTVPVRLVESAAAKTLIREPRSLVPPEGREVPSHVVPPPRTTAPETNRALDAVLSDPGFQERKLRSELGRVAELYAALFNQLDLSSAQIDKLQELIARRNLAEFNLRVASSDGAANRQLWSQLAESFKQELISLLGQSNYVLFEEHERKLPVWQLVNNFAGALAMEGDPLSLPQAEELVAVLADTSPTYQQGGTADPDEIDWPAAVEETQQVLTPVQQQIFLNFRPIYPIVFPVQ
jgi:hypothetical protein